MQTILADPFITINPSQLFNEAFVFYKTKNYSQALQLIEICCRCDPLNFHYWTTLGYWLNDLQMTAESLNAFKTASRIDSNSSLSFIIGELSQSLNLYSDALDYYSQSLSQDPRNFQAYNNKGNLLRFLNKTTDAIQTFLLGLQHCGPNNHLLNNLGNCFLELENFQAAELYYSEALKVDPSMLAAHCNLSAALKAEGKVSEAISCCARALALNPDFSEAYTCMGNIFKDMDFRKSIEFYIRAVNLNPSSVSSLLNLANLLKDSGDQKQAVFYYERTLEISAFNIEAFCNMVYSKIFICDWRDIKINFEKLLICVKHQVDANKIPSVQPFHTFVYPLAPEDKLIISKTYAYHTKKSVSIYSPFPKSPENKKIRIGYVSSDFIDHPLSHLMQNIFGMHNRAEFEVFAFALSPNDGSEYRANIMSNCDFFIDLSKVSDSYQLAAEIYKSRIDVLFNLNGYTKGSRNEIFALRPGKVQISYMGFAGSLGADYIEYLVTDKFTSPPQFAHFYSEKLIWMPYSYFVNDHFQSCRYVLQEKRPERKSLLPEDKFVFANFNQLYKIDPETFEIWMRILHRVPNSILWLLRFPSAGEENIKKSALALGIDPSRIWFTDVTNKKDHINRCFLADICLDTPLCNGHTTTCDLLWSGLPMITLPLKTLASRVAGGLCIAAGMKEFIVSSPEEYEETAVRLASGPTDEKLEESLPSHLKARLGSTELKLLRAKLEKNRVTSACFNTKLWVQHLEKALKIVMKLDKNKEEPKHIEVVDD